jgi:hypothetical protein
MISGYAHIEKLKHDPVLFARWLWPEVCFYDKQQEILYSVRDNVETVVPAGHQLGKDFVTGFLVLWFFLAHREVRIITTSVKDDHLRVLWGEIGRFIDTARFPLSYKQGGPLVINHRDIRKVMHGKVCKISYLRGMVSETAEGMAGHHAEHTLLVADEASGISDLAFERSDTWSKRRLIIGNPYPANNNYFERGVRGGDIPM